MVVRYGAAAVLAMLISACAPIWTGPAKAPVPAAAEPPVPAAPAPVPVPAPPPAAPEAKAAAPVTATVVTPPEPTTNDIAKEATKVFGVKPLMQDSVVAAVSGGAVWDIDVKSYETRTRVAYFVGVFSGRAKPEFEKSLQRQTRYGALIGKRLRDGGLPEDMTYLALIESWYDPHAYSKAAAVGMWQFMARTARGVGLRVDWWVDERRDPVRSTEGAVRMLRGLRNQFGGSVYLAAAAYDGGDGRVSRGLARYSGDLNGVEGEDRYFTLADTKYLRQETRDYVPKIIAAALVGKEPARYNVKVDTLASFAYDSVMVPGATPLAAVGNATGNSVQLMKDFNTHLLRGMTAPGDASWVRVPPGAASAFDEKFSALEAGERAAGQRVESRKGESMSSIAKKHGITTKQLNWYNPKVSRLKTGNLVAGQKILVPSRATLSAALDVPDPSIERYPRKAKVTKKPAVKKAPAKKPPAKK